MAVYVDDRIKGKAIYVSKDKIARGSIPAPDGTDDGLTAGVPMPVMQVNDYALNPTARSIDEVAIFGDANTGGETKPEIGDLGTTEVVLTGPMVAGSRGIESLIESVEDQTDVYLEYFLPGSLEGFKPLSSSETIVVAALTSGAFTGEMAATLVGMDVFLDDVVGGYGLGVTSVVTQVDKGEAPVFALGDWRVDRLNPADLKPILSNWPDIAAGTAVPTLAVASAGVVYLYRPDKWIQLRVQALSHPSEAQAGAASFNGTLNLVLQSRDNEGFFPPRRA